MLFFVVNGQAVYLAQQHAYATLIIDRYGETAPKDILRTSFGAVSSRYFLFMGFRPSQYFWPQ